MLWLLTELHSEHEDRIMLRVAESGTVIPMAFTTKIVRGDIASAGVFSVEILTS
jgi:hypothetical protein